MKMNETKKEKRTLKDDMALNWRACRLLWNLCPRFFCWELASNIWSSVRLYFAPYMSALLINELTGGCSRERLFGLVAVTVLGGLLISLFTRFIQGRKNVWNKVFYNYEDIYFLNYQNSMPYIHLEDPEVTLLREQIYALKNACGGGLMQVRWNIQGLVGNAVQIFMSLGLSLSLFRMAAQGNFTGFLAFADSPWSLLSLGLLLAVSSYVSVRLTNTLTTKVAKETEQVASLNSWLEAAGRLWGADSYIFDMKKIILPLLGKITLRPQYLINCNRLNGKHRTLTRLLEGLVRMYLFVIVAAKAYIGAIGIGNYILYRTTVSRLMSAVGGLVDNIARLRFNGAALQQLYRFLDLPDEMYRGTLAVEKRDDIDYEIEFRNVSFRYPRTENYVLKNVNMKFRIGDKLAIVGENGSGKTTFIKLLCRLYDPTEGMILLNGIDITRYRYDEYLKLFSVVFQDYRLFDFSIGTNVSARDDYDRDRVKDCLVKAGLGEKLEKLDKGVETALGRDYDDGDGVDLSGGEEQKLALARALYKDAPFVILDEPTAALDPLAEAEVYANFNRLVEHKTSVFISHRLSSCRFCDDIIVLDNGEIVQRGVHEELVADEGGKYSQLWNAQAKYYV